MKFDSVDNVISGSRINQPGFFEFPPTGDEDQSLTTQSNFPDRPKVVKPNFFSPNYSQCDQRNPLQDLTNQDGPLRKLKSKLHVKVPKPRGKSNLEASEGVTLSQKREHPPPEAPDPQGQKRRVMSPHVSLPLETSSTVAASQPCCSP